MDALTEHGLVAEVAGGTFSFKNKISSISVKTLWDKLARFVADSLKQQKGVLLPNLGTFTVGPVVGEARKKVRPTFALLETRYSGVSQERPKYSIGGRCPVVQPNYGLLATATAVHRGACQRLLLELMQRLGVHILSGRPIQVALPGVGRLFTNKAGRIQFDFDHLLREFFELERERVIPEMEQGDAAAVLEEPVAQVVKGLQQVHLHNPPAIRSRSSSGAAHGAPSSPSARVKRNAHAPYKGELLDLWRLCKTNDRLTSGCVPRLQLEQWLHKECPQVLRQVAAATVLELLSINTYGKTGKHILYKPFLDQLEAAVAKAESSSPRGSTPRRVVEVRIDSPASAPRGRQLQRQDGGGDGDEEVAVAEVTLSPVQHGSAQQQRQPLSPSQAVASQQGQPQPYWHAPAQGQYNGHQAYVAQGQHPFALGQQQTSYPSYPAQQYPTPGQGQWPPQQGQHAQYPQQQGQHTPHGQYLQQGPYPQAAQLTPNGQPGQYTPQGQHPGSQQPPHSAKAQYTSSSLKPPHTPASAMQAWQAQGQVSQPSDPKPYHYYQDKLSPRSRRDFDNFNRLHFQKLEQVRGADYKHRAVTPKVGEDELNRQEYQAIRQAASTDTVAQILSMQEDAPYRADGPHPIVLAQKRRGSPGPRPQILTLAHESPTYVTVPGLPTHQYQLQQPPMTPQQPHGVRQSTPLQQQPYSAQQQRAQPQDESPPISQYEIINESDPVKRQIKRNELASALNREWSEQIREKEVVLGNLAEAESRWPYVPTHRPNDKRPADAVSRPMSAWGPYAP